MKSRGIVMTGRYWCRWKSLTLVPAFLSLSATVPLVQTVAIAHSTRRARTQAFEESAKPPKPDDIVSEVFISSPKNGAVFYGEYTQKLCGGAKYRNGDPVAPNKLRWSKTIGGKTTLIGNGTDRLGCVTHTFTGGDYKITLEVVDGRQVVRNTSISVAFLDPVR